jgi:hypothetical protein
LPAFQQQHRTIHHCVWDNKGIKPTWHGMFAFMLNIHDTATSLPRKQLVSSFCDHMGATAAVKSSLNLGKKFSEISPKYLKYHLFW